MFGGEGLLFFAQWAVTEWPLVAQSGRSTRSWLSVISGLDQPCSITSSARSRSVAIRGSYGLTA
jgi:hypothetical protein